MTWAHLQALRGAARAQIDRRMAALQPRGGAGVYINGSSLALEPRQRPAGRRRSEDWALCVFISVAVSVRGVDVEGNPYVHDHPPTPLQFAGVVMPSGLILRTYAWERTQLFDLADEEPPFTIRRTVDVRFQVRSFPREQVPVPGAYDPDGERLMARGRYRGRTLLLIEQRDLEGRVHHQKTVTVTRSGGRYTAEPAVTGQHLELYFNGLARE